MHIPEWINPDNSQKRVFIYKGRLHIVPLSYSVKTISHGLRPIFNPVVTTECSKSVQKDLWEKLKEYPGVLTKNPGPNFHSCKVALPLSVAHVLSLAPYLISDIVDTFYHRDMISLRAVRKMNKFTPDKKNTVFTTVRFTQTLYAQLDSQQFDVPKHFRLADYKRANTDVKKHAYDLGVKVACGLEMLYQTELKKQNKQKKRTIKEKRSRR
eukprot:UN33176